MRKLEQNGRITIEYIPTKIMMADALTKPLPRPQYNALIEIKWAYSGWNKEPNGCQR